MAERAQLVSAAGGSPMLQLIVLWRMMSYDIRAVSLMIECGSRHTKGDQSVTMAADHDARPMWPRRPARLSKAVLAEFTDQIVRGQPPPGGMLPTEPTLCATFGVSRSVIREALKLLEEKGLVHVRQGQGTTVAPIEEWDLLDPVVLDAAIRHDETLAILDDLIEVRVALESQMVRRAATTMTDGELAELGELLRRLDSQLHDPEQYLMTDTLYHDFILRCSKNALGRSIVRSIHGHARGSNRYRGVVGELDLQYSHRGHVAVYESLCRHDPEAAAAAMHEHIMGSWLIRSQNRDVPVRNARRAHKHAATPQV